MKGCLSNYAATYYIGILLAHCLLKKFDEEYLGNEITTSEGFNVEEGIEGNGSFRALIKVGFMKTKTNNVRVCATLKGALDALVWTFPIVHVLAKRTRI